MSLGDVAPLGEQNSFGINAWFLPFGSSPNNGGDFGKRINRFVLSVMVTVDHQ